MDEDIALALEIDSDLDAGIDLDRMVSIDPAVVAAIDLVGAMTVESALVHLMDQAPHGVARAARALAPPLPGWGV
jgi:hypothetical protein